jgi:hypothetical protein
MKTAREGTPHVPSFFYARANGSNAALFTLSLHPPPASLQRF